MECEFVKISKEKLKDNCFIVKLGSESRPATEEDMVNFNEGLMCLFETLDLDFTPAVLITHHAFNINEVSRQDIKELIKTL